MILENGLRVYHGSYTNVEKPDLKMCKAGKDFGVGFYVTTDLEQARRFVRLSVGKAQKKRVLMTSVENEYTIELLAAMASQNIARRQKISRIKAFMRFMKSKTAEMLFDESTYMWMNGPDYIADEYRREKKTR